MRKVMVGRVPVGDASGMMSDFWGKMGAGSLTWKQFAAFLRKENPFEGDSNEWFDEIVAKEKATHIAFFGQAIASRFDYSMLEETLKQSGQAEVAKWDGLGLRVGFLPPVEMKQESCYPGWKVKPNDWFYRMIREGKVDKKALYLGDPEKGGEVVLFDTRCKPNYNEGKQMWEGDEKFFGPIIEGLRNGGKIAKYEYGPQSSRFGMSAVEAEKYVYPALANSFGFNSEQVMSEGVVQGSYLSQAYSGLPRFKDSQTSTWVWFKESFEGGGFRLCGGFSGGGGRAGVDYYLDSDHWSFISCLPLVVLSP